MCTPTISLIVSKRKEKIIIIIITTVNNCLSFSDFGNLSGRSRADIWVMAKRKKKIIIRVKETDERKFLNKKKNRVHTLTRTVLYYSPSF